MRGRDVYRLLGDFSVVQDEDSAERSPLSHLNVLDTDRRPGLSFFRDEEYRFRVFWEGLLQSSKKEIPSMINNEMHMKVKAVIEVVIVFSFTLLFVALVGLSPIGNWERQVTNRFFIEYGVMITFPVLLLVVARRNLASYGLSLRNVSYHLDVTATAFVPVAIASAPLAFINYKQWSGALILAGVQIAVLLALGWRLKRKPTQHENGLLVGAILLMTYSDFTPKATLDNAISAFFFYILFLGLGEELLFRGYIQSRLNAVFGKPFQFYGVNWGWGIIIASALFGFMHVLNIGSLVNGNWELGGWWGFWTFFGGLVFGFVREKTGSIAASTLLHGLPQAIAYAMLGL